MTAIDFDIESIEQEFREVSTFGESQSFLAPANLPAITYRIVVGSHIISGTTMMTLEEEEAYEKFRDRVRGRVVDELGIEDDE